MRASPSLQSVLAVLALLSASAAAADTSSSDNVVTVYVKSTITTCATRPPPPCSSVTLAGSTSSVTTTSDKSSATSSSPNSSKASSDTSSYPTTSITTSKSTTTSTLTSTKTSSTSEATGSSSSGTASASTSSSTSSGSTSLSSSSSSSTLPTGTCTKCSQGTTSSASTTDKSTTSSASSSTSSATASTSNSLTSSTSSSSATSSSLATSSTSKSTISTTSSTSVTSTTSSSSSTQTVTSSSSSSSSSSVSKTTSSGSSTSSSSSSSTTKSTTSSSSSSTTTSKTTSTTSSSTTYTAPACTDYWLSTIKHQGKAPYAAASNYQVFRNVKDFGAKGDGSTDDTAAINLAISDGGRCGPSGCNSSSTTPALVYFPPGTYLVKKPIIDYYYTQLIGNPSCLPVIKADASFTDAFVIDGSQYQAGGKLPWGATNTFWRQVRNFVVDLTAVPYDRALIAIHWPTAQATSLQNIVVKMSTTTGTKHVGMLIEEGSGGFLTDLVFYGGAQGMQVGNQQFTMRNLTFYGADTAIQQLWDWGWTYKGLSINNCRVGIDMTGVNNGGLTVGSVVLIDSDISNTPVGVAFGNTAATGPKFANNLAIENVRLNNVPVAIQGPGQTTVLAGTTAKSTIAGWGRGNKYTPNGPVNFQGPITPNARPASLVSGADYYERSKPQYEELPVAAFVSVRDAGAKGDGKTDDTAAINKAITSAAAVGKVLFFDAGDYVVTSTIYVPGGSRIVGEAYSVIISQGDSFNDINKPKPVVQVGIAGEAGTVEWSDMIISTRGQQAGAILVEWNLASLSTPSGIWDVHTRVGGFKGSNLQVADCPKTPNVVATSANLNKACIAAFMSVHVTSSATGLYLENVWLWVADHDVEDATLSQITIYAGRGLLIESEAGRIWGYGTAVEHHALYEYQLTSTKDVLLGQIQTETAYYQPNPDATIPFPVNAAYHDPTLAAGQSGWGVRVAQSQDILIYGAGLYSFFSNYNVTCSNQGNGETCQSRVFDIEQSTVFVYNLNTVGTQKMITLDGQDVASYADNDDGFVQSVALFRTS